MFPTKSQFPFISFDQNQFWIAIPECASGVRENKPVAYHNSEDYSRGAANRLKFK